MFHLLIGLGEDKTPIDFGFTRSKSQGSLVKMIKNVFRSLLFFTQFSYITCWLVMGEHDLYLFWVH